jgi:deazaflavin-dependent oxidoreductase (nitroreductase family)
MVLGETQTPTERHVPMPGDSPGSGVMSARRRSETPRLMTASVGLAAVFWLWWLVTPHGGGVPGPVWGCLVLAVNVVLTRASLPLKRRIVRPVQRYLINPPIRVLLAVGVPPLGYALIETTGRTSGRRRRTPVGNGLVGDTFWIVAEQGHHASYVRNIHRDPRVRVKVRKGFRPVWRQGIAEVMEDDDPYARQRFLCRWHPLRALNAAVVRVMGTDLLTVRIDLES